MCKALKKIAYNHMVQPRGVSHSGHAIFIKTHLKAKEELWKLKKYFTKQKYNLQKNPPKKTKILQDIIITL
jgi:hypothetical protein